VPYFSVAEGLPSDSKVACESAIVGQGICQPASKSVSALPVRCTSDDDCKATDGALSQCYCAGTSLNLAFCSLHYSDYPVKEYLAAVHDGAKEKSAALLLKVVHFAHLQVGDTCARDYLTELKDLKNQLEWAVLCSGTTYSFIVALALLILI
jgi:hypothetical protein